MKTTMSSGHGLHVKGAGKYIDEVTEARKVVDTTKAIVNSIDKESLTIFHENRATNKTDNLNNIIKFHNSTSGDLDISIHFNDVDKDVTNKDVGIEIIYTSETGKKHAKKLVDILSLATGLENRGAKHDLNDCNRKLGFLRNTKKPAIIIEICFVGSKKDIEKYKINFEKLCISLAEYICGKPYIQGSSKNKLYRVVTNTYSNIENAKKEIENLNKNGIKSFIHIEEE